MVKLNSSEIHAGDTFLSVSCFSYLDYHLCVCVCVFVIFMFEKNSLEKLGIEK